MNFHDILPLIEKEDFPANESDIISANAEKSKNFPTELDVLIILFDESDKI